MRLVRLVRQDCGHGRASSAPSGELHRSSRRTGDTVCARSGQASDLGKGLRRGRSGGEAAERPGQRLVQDSVAAERRQVEERASGVSRQLERPGVVLSKPRVRAPAGAVSPTDHLTYRVPRDPADARSPLIGIFSERYSCRILAQSSTLITLTGSWRGVHSRAWRTCAGRRNTWSGSARSAAKTWAAASKVFWSGCRFLPGPSTVRRPRESSGLENWSGLPPVRAVHGHVAELVSATWASAIGDLELLEVIRQV